MANRYLQQFPLSFLRKKVTVSGVFSLSAAGAVVSFDIPGAASVVAGAAGLYTITLQDAYPSFNSGTVCIAETSQDLDAKLGAVNSLSKTVVVNTKTAGANTAPSATCKIYVELTYNNSSVR